MSFGQPSMGGIFKEGTKHLSGVEEAIIRNIEATKDFMNLIRTSLGPNGMNKMVVNHLSKIFVTHDASTIVRELEIQHPAAKIIVHAAETQQKEVGDGTNFVVALAGELLAQAEPLLRMGLHPSDILEGYSKAGKKTLEFLDSLAVAEKVDVRNEESVIKALKSVIAAKQFGYEDILAPIVAKACIHALPKNKKQDVEDSDANNEGMNKFAQVAFSVDNVRVAKIEGASVAQTTFLPGFVLARPVTGTVHNVKNAKIAVYNCPMDHSSTEAKGTVTITSAEQLKSFSQEEEKILGDSIQEIADCGVNVVVCAQNISELALHFLERHKIMAIKVPSKFDVRRVCSAIGATPLIRLGKPTEEEVGHSTAVESREIAGHKVTVFVGDDTSRISTIVVRGATGNIMDDVERAIDKALNTFKVFCRHPVVIPGAGASEMELALAIQRYGDSCPGLDQYAIKKFAEALEMIPRTLAENSGANATELVSSLYAKHSQGAKNACVDVLSMAIGDAAEMQVWDALETRQWGIRLAVSAAVDVLRVDSIIVARQAGGPKGKQ
nr:T-complex protein 1 subunit theta [Andalucia godoyi]|eukprot:ANDGO_03362.mRNA.1 T-complex protein 1 subunit theta